MARSMQIQQEEEARTSWLLNGFLLVAFAWMAIGTLLSGQDAVAETTATVEAAP